MSKLRLAIVGANGRVGSALVRLAADEAQLALAAALARPGSPRLGQDAGALAGVPLLGVALADRCAAACDVLIDFSEPVACVTWANWAAQRGVAFVSGTTGLSDQQQDALSSAAERIPLLWSANMSMGANLLIRVVRDAARALGPTWDVEIVEAHHRRKVDAPSGTAKALLSALCEGRGAEPGRAVLHGREGLCGPRKTGEIGIHAARLGGVIGEHEVFFATDMETISFRHNVVNRDVFAAGALSAARWLVGRPPGRYTMADVLANA